VHIDVPIDSKPFALSSCSAFVKSLRVIFIFPSLNDRLTAAYNLNILVIWRISKKYFCNYIDFLSKPQIIATLPPERCRQSIYRPPILGMPLSWHYSHAYGVQRLWAMPRHDRRLIQRPDAPNRPIGILAYIIVSIFSNRRAQQRPLTFKLCRHVSIDQTAEFERHTPFYLRRMHGCI
jgi:hypothetical protein